MAHNPSITTSPVQSKNVSLPGMITLQKHKSVEIAPNIINATGFVFAELGVSNKQSLQKLVLETIEKGNGQTRNFAL